ncbi:MAG: hypothetical protein ABIK68_04045, partial [bacterium]
PVETIEKLGNALRLAASQKAFVDGMKKQGFHLINLGPKEFGEFIQKRKEQYIKVLKNGGFLK